jgi:hypothetical protein
MQGGKMRKILLLAIAAGLALCGRSRAEDGLLCGKNRQSPCPRQIYSRCDFLTPACFRVKAFVQRNGTYIYAVDNYPDMPLHNQAIPFRCGAIPPEAYPFPPYDLNPPQQPAPDAKKP